MGGVLIEGWGEGWRSWSHDETGGTAGANFTESYFVANASISGTDLNSNRTPLSLTRRCWTTIAGQMERTHTNPTTPNYVGVPQNRRVS